MGARDPSQPRWRRKRVESAGRPDLTQVPDELGIDAARAGDLGAWEQIIRRHQEATFRSAYLTTRDSVGAEETTKAVFVRAYRSLDSLGRGQAMRPWLLRMTATMARNHLRATAQRRDAKVAEREPCPRLRATPIFLEPGLPRPTPAGHEALVNAFDGLADEDRIVLATSYSLGLSRDDQAARLGIGPDEVDGRLDASVKRLRSHLGELMAGRGSSGNPGAPAGASTVRPNVLVSLGRDALGKVTMAAVMSELPWTPDVAPLVCARLAREAIAYPDQFGLDVPAASSGARPEAATGQPSATVVTRAVGRKGTPARGRGQMSMATAAFVVIVAIVGFSVTAGAQRWGIWSEVGAGLESLFGQQPQPAVVDVIEAPVVVQRPVVDAAPPAGVAPGLPIVEQARVGAPELSIVGARTLANGDVGARVRVEPPRLEGFGPVVSTRLERKIDAGAWVSAASTDAQGPLEAGIGPGKRYRFRTRSIDATGASVLSPAVHVELAVYDPRSRRLVLPSSDWITRYGEDIKRRLIATTPDASFSVAFTGSGVALVGPAGPSRGAIGVRVDGGPWTSDDLTTWLTSARTVVFSQDLEHGRHSLDVRAEADGVAVDAVLIMRTAQA